MLKFVTDSSCDINSYEDINLAVAPLKIYTAERDFIDTPDMDVHEMLDYLLSYKDRSYTSCPSAESWLSAFEGGEEIYVITLTSHLSGTYNSACAAKELYMEQHPEAKILVIDTLSTGPEMRLILENLVELKKSGLSFEEVSERIKKYLSATRLFFAFQSLHNFAQNGRVSKIVASAIGILNISIMGTASEEGNIQPMSKCRGEAAVIEKLKSEMLSAGFRGGKIRICHIENEMLANKVGEAMKAVFPDTDLLIYPARGLCSYYGERGGIIIGCEC